MQATEKESNLLLIIGEVKYTASGHTINEWFSGDLNLGFFFFLPHVVFLPLLKGQSHNLKVDYMKNGRSENRIHIKLYEYVEIHERCCQRKANPE